MRQTPCKGCGVHVLWIKTDTGKMMPVNMAMVPFWERPGAKGKVVLLSGKIISCDFEGRRDEVTGFGYVSHFATCPAAKDFRRKKK